MDARFQKLPLELIHYVLEDLDKPSLATCTLTSRNFMELARPHLFRSVIWTFSRLQRSYALDRPVQHLSRLPESFHLLAEFLESQPTIASHVRHVHLCMIEDVAFSSFEVFLRILRHLTRLLTLSLDGIPGDQVGRVIPDPREMLDLPLLADVQTLKLKDLSPRQPTSISYVLCLFGSIDHLIITDAYEASPHGIKSFSPGIPHPAPRVLELHKRSAFAFVNLAPWPELRQIHILNILLPRSNGLLAMQELVTKMGPALQHVHCNLVRVGRYPLYTVRKGVLVHKMAQGSLDLSRASSLESIVLPLFICHVVPDEPQDTAARPTSLIHQVVYSFVVATLATAPRSVRTVTFELTVELVADSWQHTIGSVLKPTPLEELRQLRELEDVCSRMTALQTIEVRAIPECSLSEDEKQKLGEAVPRLVERGVLRFS